MILGFTGHIYYPAPGMDGFVGAFETRKDLRKFLKAHGKTHPFEWTNFVDTTTPEASGQFLVFSGMNYYPSGGFGDFKASFTTQEEAQAYIDTTLRSDDWHQLVDTANLPQTA